MTESFPSSGADDHPEVAEISALGEGLLPPERATEVSAHLSSCSLCADVRGSLEEIRAALGTLPGPVRMPEDVASRIDAALAAEALLDSTNRGTSPAERAPDAAPIPSPDRETVHTPHTVSRETVKPDAVRHRRGSSRRPPSHPAGGAGPGRAPRRRRLALTVAAACAALVVGGLMVPLLFNESGGQQQAADSGTESDRGINAAELDTQVRELLDTSPGDTSKEEPSVEGSQKPGQPDARENDGTDTDVSPKASPTAPLGAESAVSVPACVSEGIDRNEAQMSATLKTYEGIDSYVVVLPHAGNQQRVDAYVVDASCVDAASDEPGEIVARETIARR